MDRAFRKIRFGSTFRPEPGCVCSIYGEIDRWQQGAAESINDPISCKAAETVAQAMQALLRTRGKIWLYDASLERGIVHEVLEREKTALLESGFSPEEHHCVRVGSLVGPGSVSVYLRMNSGLSVTAVYEERLTRKKVEDPASCRAGESQIVFLEVRTAA